MKLKQRPEDFQVEELTDVAPQDTGPFALYRLTKRGWTTHDALTAIRQRWQLDQQRVSCGGLKDRHALTMQYLTIYRGPQRRLTHAGVQLEYLGQVREPFTAEHIRANRFTIALRALDETALAQAQQALAEAAADGVPNYFDDQRFGSVQHDGAFMAQALVRGDYERALQLALAAPYEHDRAPDRKEKALLLQYWGDWAQCLAQLPRGQAHSLVAYLKERPQDFRGALCRLQPELRSLYLAAYQSHLWNRMLARWLAEQCRPEQRLQLRLKLAEVVVPRGLDDAQRQAFWPLQWPLPSARQELADDDPRQAIVAAILAEEGITRAQLKLRGLRELFFSRGFRQAYFQVEEVQATGAADELNAGQRKLQLRFELPRGCYATLLVKRITTACSAAQHAE